MATARKKSAAPKPKPKSKGSKAAPAKAKSPAKKPVAAKAKPSAKPAPKAAAKKPVPMKAAASKPVPKVVGKPAVSGKTIVGKPAVAGKGVVGKPAVAGKPVVGRPAVAGKGVVGKPAVAGKGVIGKPAVPGKKAVPEPPAKPRIPKLVPATDAARAAAAAAARVGKPGGRKGGANRPEPEVRPLGVLPPSSQAKPRVSLPPRPVAPERGGAGHKGAVKPQPVKKGDDRLSPEDLKQFEQRLLEARARITHEMGHLETTVLKVNPRDAASELSGYSYHMADAGTDSMEREKAFDIASKEGRLLLEIDDALRRLYNGTYGICEISGKPIGRARLEALPWARLSLDEQEKLEKEQRAGRSMAAEKE